ncbi:MAG TPA: phage tail sheath C-terminal domain-containing protein [Nitrososphaeraceae archaeon]|nr:phage tail sheath C-terminal domain-containing protein [Nitrososphaeraceae archaeon]
MPEYLSPGLYIEETDIDPSKKVNTDIAGFLGQTERGPISPKFITSFEEFIQIFGGFIETSYLAYGVDGFFRNGGRGCYVARIVGKNTKTSNFSLNAGNKTINIMAIGPGSWGRRIQFKINKSRMFNEDTYFRLSVIYYSNKDIHKFNSIDDDTKIENATLYEVYDNLSTNPQNKYFYKNQINGISNIIQVSDNYSEEHGIDDLSNLSIEKIENFISLGGEDIDEPITKDDYYGYYDPNNYTYKRGLKALEDIEEISILTIPDQGNFASDITDLMISHCEKLKNRFAIIQSKKNDIDNIDNPNLILGKQNSKYSAIYFPWFFVDDPITKYKKLVPPGGHIAGIYARTDIERGVHKAPENESIRGIVSLQANMDKEKQEILNLKGLNVIRSFSGRGPILWGARTTSKDHMWKYVNVRRLFIFIEKSVERLVQWTVFGPNNERLWSRIKATLTQFLTTVWKTGALMGTTREEVFFVKCDKTTMTQDDIDNGRLIVVIGIAPTKPAEFVIFRLTQTLACSEVEES